MKLFDWHKLKTRKHCTAVIVAAGSAQRMKGIDKIMVPLCEKPVIYYSLQAFQDSSCIDEIVVVTRTDLIPKIREIGEHYHIDKLRAVVEGGATRMESVEAGILAASKKTVLIAVHDGARPMVTHDVIKNAVDMALTYHAAAPAIPVKDTIKVIDDTSRVIDTPKREMLRAVQTPQVFDCDLLLAAWKRAKKEKLTYTDDSGAMEGLGVHVYLTEGSEENIKITTPMDLRVAEMILKGRE